MEIVLIRHGETKANAINQTNRKMYIGRADYPLSEKGIQQAQSLRGNQALEGIDHYFVSPLLRAKQTVEIITDQPYSIDERLSERSLGVFEDRFVDEIQSLPQYQEYFSGDLKDFAHSYNHKAPEGESYTDVCERVASFIEDLKKTDYQRVAVVCHFCTIRCFMAEAKAIEKEAVFNQKVYPCQPIIIHL